MNEFPENLAKFTHNGIVFDQTDGRGAVPNVLDVDYFGFTVLMRPSVFLDLCPAIPDNNPIHFDAPMAMPYLKVDLGSVDRIVGHEGRHRMKFCIDTIGDDPLPIAFLLARGDRARHVEMDHLHKMSRGMFAERGEDYELPRYIPGPLFQHVRLQGNTVDLHGSRLSSRP